MKAFIIVTFQILSVLAGSVKTGPSLIPTNASMPIPFFFVNENAPPDTKAIGYQ